MPHLADRFLLNLEGVAWLMHTCDMAHLHVWHDPFICVTLPMHMCDMTQSHVWHDSFICMKSFFLNLEGVTWLIHMCGMPIHEYDMTLSSQLERCDVTNLYAWQYSFVRATCLIHVYEMMLPPQLAWFDVTHSHVWLCSCTWVTWRFFFNLDGVCD